MASRLPSRAVALVPLSIWAFAFYTKRQNDVVVEMLWFCYVACFMLGVALLIRSHILLTMAALVSLFSPIFYVLAGQKTGWGPAASLAVHFATPIVAVLSLVRARHVPLSARAYGYWFMLALVVVSFFFTPASLNINLAHGPYFDGDPTAGRFYFLFLSLEIYTLLWVADRIVRFVVEKSRPAAPGGLST